MVREFARKHGSALRSFAMVGGALATTAAGAAGAVLAPFPPPTRGVLAATADSRGGLRVIEARHLGGHHWVAYGWNERGR